MAPKRAIVDSESIFATLVPRLHTIATQSRNSERCDSDRLASDRFKPRPEKLRMTEFEMASLAQELHINRTAQLSLIISIMSAFLVVGYTAAHRLTFTLNALIVGLYSLVLFPRIVGFTFSSMPVVGLHKAMAERFAKGIEFQWDFALVPGSSLLADYLVELIAVTWISIFVATIAFYFLARQMNLKREREEAAKLATAGKVEPLA